METAIVVALIGIGGTLVNAAYTTRVAVRSQRLAAELAARDRAREHERTKEAEVQRLLARYRDPLLRASFDLQSRMYNIVEENFLAAYGTRPDTEEYVRENTLFVLAELLGWIEILRREVRFLDLGVEAENQLWVKRLAEVRKVLQRDRHGPVLQVLNGQQRAIGELMIVAVGEPSEGGPRQETMGYAAFVARRREDPEFAGWFDRLAADVALLGTEPGDHTRRLVMLQRALIDLMAFLDPQCERLPADERTKLAAPRGLDE